MSQSASTKTEYKQACGCIVRLDYDEYTDGQSVVDEAYIKHECPLHAAAPELLEALKAFDEGLKDGSIKFTKPRQSDKDPYHKANVLMHEAFAHAEGRP